MGDDKSRNRIKSFGASSASHEQQKEKVGEPKKPLDLFSTSPTYSEDLCFTPCVNHAPIFAFNKHDKTYGIAQGCCNDWKCPRCGILRAKQEYGRILEGCKTLSATGDLYFITITCRGKEISHEEAEKNYGIWTNRLLDSWRLQSKRTHQKWAYVQVTERQKRGHPHSHILTTFKPLDMAVDWKWKRVSVEGRQFMAYVSCFRSEYIAASVIRSGLGDEYDISVAQTVGGVARYVAKYLFKDTIFSTTWPSGWRRVRYSQSFPKLPDRKSDAFVLIKREDWQRLAREAIVVTTHDRYCTDEALFWLKGSDIVLLNK